MKNYCAYCGKKDEEIKTLMLGMKVMGTAVGYCDEHKVKYQECLKLIGAD